jgi:2-polyprenyl-3-methyl-5-hydroxy-6-metoxy-1,4-benzoquinol methylase
VNGAAADILEWDVENWSQALEFWRRHSLLRLSGCEALEIGSRNGGLSLWLALSGANVVCSDVNGPTEAAKHKHQRYGVAAAVKYERVNALQIPYHQAFDVVAFKSVLGGIGAAGVDSQRRAVQQMYQALKPRGELWFAENLIASPLHQALRGRFVKWGPSWRYVSLRELREFLSPFASVIIRATGVLGALGRNEPQRSVLARCDQRIVNRLVPPSWRYIALVVATKS